MTKAGAHPSRKTLFLAYTLPTSHSVHRHLVGAAEAVARSSGGALELKLFPHESFGTDVHMVESVFGGGLDFMACTGPFLGRKVPAAAAPSLPFLFNDIDAVWRAMDGTLGAQVRAALAAAGLFAFPHSFDNGFRHLTTSGRLVRNAADAVGMKMRVVAAPLHESLWQALGTHTIATDVVEIKHVLQTGEAEAQDNSLPMLEAFGIHELQSRCALTGHLWEGFWLVANSAAWQALAADEQAIFSQAFEQAALHQRADQAVSDEARRERLRAHLEFNEVDRPSFRARLGEAGFYAAWRARFDAATWDLLEQHAGQKL